MRLHALTGWCLLAALLAGCSGATTGSTSPTAVASPSSAAPSASASASQSASPTALPYEQLLSDGTFTTPQICSSYRTLVDRYLTTAKQRLGSGDGFVKDHYVAYDYRKAHPWVKTPIWEKFNAEMGVMALRSLDTLSGGRAAEVDSLTPFLTDSLAGCGLSKAYADARLSSAKADALGRKINASANKRPWYPKGYKEVNSDVAYKWVQYPSCPWYSRCSQAYFVAREGCPNGLYVDATMWLDGEMSYFTESDSVSHLRRNHTVTLSFVTYFSNATAFSISTANCY